MCHNDVGRVYILFHTVFVGIGILSAHFRHTVVLLWNFVENIFAQKVQRCCGQTSIVEESDENECHFSTLLFDMLDTVLGGHDSVFVSQGTNYR